MELIILGAGILAGLYMAWNIGANDASNAMASAVGAKAISIRQAVFIAGILDFAGAAFIGSHVTQAIRKNIVALDLVGSPDILMVGLLAALISASFWLFFSTWKSYPISTTHSIVGAMIGFGLAAGGFSAIQWGKILAIVASWVISPIFAGAISAGFFHFIRKRILFQSDPFRRALRLTPFFAGLGMFIISMSLFLKTPLGNKLGIDLAACIRISLGLSLLLAFLTHRYMKRYVRMEGEEGAEEIFRRLQIATSCYVALAHGANDVANAMGPLAGIYLIIVKHAVAPEIQVPFFLLVIGGLGIAVGVFTWGYRVIATVGTKITTLTNTRGFSVDFGTATSVLIASKMGLPVSTTHAAVGAVVGVGLARGLEAVDLSLVGRIVLYWLITLPAAAISCMIVYTALKAILL